jgi:hypothetical protein
MKRTALTVVLAVLTVSLIGPTGCKKPFCPTTEEPYVIIDQPPPSQVLPPVVVFHWHSGLETDPRGVRYFLSKVVDTNGVYDPSFNIVRDLNENLWRYEEWWSKWKNYSTGNNSGRQTIIGDDETLDINYSYIFAVQAIDRCGRVTETFTRDTNVRQFIVSQVAGPMLLLTEPFLGFYKFTGDDIIPVGAEFPPGVPLKFSWFADASSYGGEIVAYRYGWDIQDLNDPSQWNTEYLPFLLSASEKTLYSGIHTFYVEARDNAGNSTIGAVEVSIVPFPMERNLLWVDDFYSTDFTQILYHIPTETEHDTFWLDICSRAEGFMPGVDVFDTRNTAFRPPDLSKIGQYKNIIWTYSNDPQTTAWDNVVRFVPESMVGCPSQPRINYIPLFLAKGGHIMTLGRSDREGGLAAVLYPFAQQFPLNLKYEIAGIGTGDQSGAYSMPYKDYCVTVLDKVVGIFRTDLEMPIRSVDRDAMYDAYKDETFGYNDTYPGLPDQLQLWEEVTAPGRFFDPQVRGFTYVEIYDPEYWMDITYARNQDCFAPMYRMRTRNSLSPVHNTTIALWLTKYENIVPDVVAGIAVPARSVHFGFPLWFFNRTQVDQLVDVIFDEWQINTNP